MGVRVRIHDVVSVPWRRKPILVRRMKSKLVPFTVLIGLLPVSANDSSFDRSAQTRESELTACRMHDFLQPNRHK